MLPSDLQSLKTESSNHLTWGFLRFGQSSVFGAAFQEPHSDKSGQTIVSHVIKIRITGGNKNQSLTTQSKGLFMF